MGITSRLQQACFHWIHGNNLVYNTCWEDPRLDRVALDLRADSTVAMITSAGCNALDYLLDEPAAIYTIDVNPRQNSLLELKIAGIRELEYSEFFQMFGRGNIADYQTVYHSRLRKHLSKTAQKYWDRHAKFFAPTGRNRSFYFRGTSGFFARTINWYIDHWLKIRPQIMAILNAHNIDEQRSIYETQIKPRFWNKPLEWFLGRPTTMSLLGVPPAQQQHVENHFGTMAKFIQQCIDAVFGELPLHDNYFWRVYLTGEYTQQCCPEYLKAENFLKLRNLVDRIHVENTTVEQFLRSTTTPISHLVLLDHMDWLASHRIDWLQSEWQAIIDKATPNARILWRSGGLETSFIDKQQVQVRDQQVAVGDLLRYQTDLAEQLHPLDRVHTYGCFRIANLAV
jgi:S-adenosylmethionine-diacylglycerol 3-amino-3-carboxypropyl transferase